MVAELLLFPLDGTDTAHSPRPRATARIAMIRAPAPAASGRDRPAPGPVPAPPGRAPARPRRIAHVTDTSIYNFDGISTYVNGLAASAGDAGDRSLVLTAVPVAGDRLREVRHGAEVRVFPRLGALSTAKFSFGLPWGLGRVLDGFRPDLVWIHTLGPLGLAAARAARGKYRIVYTKHCFEGELLGAHLRLGAGLRRLAEFLAARAEGYVLDASDRALYHFDDIGRIGKRRAAGKFRYFPPPLNPRFLAERSHRGRRRGQGWTIGFCGRLDPEKCIERIFEAAEIYRRRHPGSRLNLLFIGDGRAAAPLLRRYPRVRATVTGFVDDVIPYLDRLDAFVLASRTETTSLSSLEAYARGLPILSTAVGVLGRNPGRYRRIHTFRTPEELAALIHSELELKRPPAPRAPARPDASIVTFPRLYSQVLGGGP